MEIRAPSEGSCLSPSLVGTVPRVLCLFDKGTLEAEQAESPAEPWMKMDSSCFHTLSWQARMSPVRPRRCVQTAGMIRVLWGGTGLRDPEAELGLIRCPSENIPL